MVLGCANKTIKVMVFFFNFLAFLCGAALIVIAIMGIISASMVSQFQEFGYSNDMIKISLYVILGLGVLIALLGFLGCCGACCENQCLLGTFAVFMLVLLLAQIAIGILTAVVVLKGRNSDIAKEKLRLEETIAKLTDESMLTENSDVCIMWKHLQENGTCCGLNGEPETTVTIRCNVDCQPHAKKIGCPERRWKVATKYLVIAGGTVAGFIFLQIFALSFACCLCCQIRKERASGY